MTNVFAYGTLMWPSSMFCICAGEFQHCDATLKGFQRYHIKGKIYPGLIKSEKDEVKGTVYLNLSPTELQNFIDYECEYDPVEVTVYDPQSKPIKALVCLYKKPEQLMEIIWDPKQYQAKYRQW